MPRMASAISAAPVGQPHWSATTWSRSRSRPRRNIVLTKFAPCVPKTQEVRRITWRSSRSRTARLAGCLAGPVDAERPDRIVFGVGRRLGAVEHVVGGKVDERDPGVGRGFGQMGRPVGVDGERRIRLRFGAINGGVGGGVDDQRRSVALHDTPDRIPIGDIEIVVAKPDRR